ncbi:unnamed protein product [Arabidopsis halleri]
MDKTLEMPMLKRNRKRGCKKQNIRTDPVLNDLQENPSAAQKHMQPPVVYEQDFKSSAGILKKRSHQKPLFADSHRFFFYYLPNLHLAMLLCFPFSFKVIMTMNYELGLY